MNAFVGRLFVAVWFLGIVSVAISGGAARGQANGVLTRYLPLMTGGAPFQADPTLRDYLGLITANSGGWKLYTVRADGSDLRRLSGIQVAGSVLWSPDGARVAFERYPPMDPPGNPAMVMNLDGSDVRPVLASPEPDEQVAM